MVFAPLGGVLDPVALVAVAHRPVLVVDGALGGEAGHRRRLLLRRRPAVLVPAHHLHLDDGQVDVFEDVRFPLRSDRAKLVSAVGAVERRWRKVLAGSQHYRVVQADL